VSRALPSVVFLDRDGTIIEDTHFVRRLEDVRVLPGAAEAIAKLNAKKIPVVVVTNQSGIARGLITVAEYEAVKARLDELLAAKSAHIDRSYYCPHHPDVTGPCDCRKPAARMFRDAIRDLGVASDGAAYIGDRWRDLAASEELGGRAILVASSMTRKEDIEKVKKSGIAIAADLQDAVARLLTLTEAAAKK
jgi:D-glycero-D-manno-heptose 1,7-bisphosphate phosphatase